MPRTAGLGYGSRRAASRDLPAPARPARKAVWTVGGIIWSMNSPEFYLLLVEQRGWSSGDFEDWLADAWIQLLLKP